MPGIEMAGLKADMLSIGPLERTFALSAGILFQRGCEILDAV